MSNAHQYLDSLNQVRIPKQRLTTSNVADVLDLPLTTVNVTRCFNGVDLPLTTSNVADVLKQYGGIEL
jgi:hypothetical protein